MIDSVLRTRVAPIALFMVMLSANCSREKYSLPEIPSSVPPQPEVQAVPEPVETPPPYTGQQVLFIKSDSAALYSRPSDSASVRTLLKRDALLVLMSESEGFVKVHAPITGEVGYVKAVEVTDSIRTSAVSQMRCSELGKETRVQLMKAFDCFPTIEALEKYYLYPFITSDDMVKMIAHYKGDISKYTFTGQSSAWELASDSLPKAVVKKLRSDSLRVSMDAFGLKMVLLAGDPFLYTQNEYDEEGVVKKTSGDAVRTIKSRLFEESIRLIQHTRESGISPIIVTHGPPHHECHQCEIPVSLFGAGKFIHTYEKHVPVKLLLKMGFADGYITRIEHSTFEVSPCYLDGGTGLFYIETKVPEGEKILGVLLGLDTTTVPVVNVAKNGDWSADLNNDGINDLRCVFYKIPGGYDDLMSAYYFVNKHGVWILTDIRNEPACT